MLTYEGLPEPLWHLNRHRLRRMYVGTARVVDVVLHTPCSATFVVGGRYSAAVGRDGASGFVREGFFADTHLTVWPSAGHTDHRKETP